MADKALVWAVVAVLFLAMGCGGEGDEGSPTMRPGEDCLSCHSGGEEGFSAGGTVQTVDGAGVAGLTVTLVDSASTEASTTTNSVGNFYFDQALVAPFQVAITDGATTVEMQDAPGACNSCHRSSGSAQAPIIFP